nr:MAG TPA: hypothetical protein [Bacteriophage sp.]
MFPASRTVQIQSPTPTDSHSNRSYQGRIS